MDQTSEKAKKVERVFVAKGKKAGFFVPMRDPDDPKKFLNKQNPATGRVYVQRGKILIERRHVRFVDELEINPKKGLSMVYRTSDPDEIEVLDKLAADGITAIMTWDDYAKTLNPDAFKAKRERDQLARERDEAKTELEKANKIIDNMRNQRKN